MQSEIDCLAFRFFKLFAKYEYALKALGFLGRKRVDGQFVYVAEPNWDAFSSKINFDELVHEIPEEVNYLCDFPPKHQKVDEKGDIFWVEAGKERSAQALVRHICRVRNNLFHGGKFTHMEEWIETERSKKLIECALSVLECIQKNNHQLDAYIATSCF